MKNIEIKTENPQEEINKLNAEIEEIKSQNFIICWNNGEMNEDEVDEELIVVPSYEEAESFILEETHEDPRFKKQENRYVRVYSAKECWDKQEHDGEYYYIVTPEEKEKENKIMKNIKNPQEEINKLNEKIEEIKSQNYIVRWNNGEMNEDEVDEELIVTSTYEEAENFILEEIHEDSQFQKRENCYVKVYPAEECWDKKEHDGEYYYIINPEEK